MDVMSTEHERQLFDKHSDKFKRLNLSSFLSACRELKTEHAHSACCRTAADPTLPHTERWPELHTNGKTAMEKRELSSMVQALRDENQRLAPLESQYAVLGSQCLELTTERDALMAERDTMQRELKSEREWLEAQLQDELRAKTQAQWELRAELTAQQQQAKAAMQSEHEAQVGGLRAALEAQANSHKHMLEEQHRLVELLQSELQKERSERAKLAEFLECVDVEKLRTDCSKYQRELTAQTQLFSTRLGSAHAEYNQTCSQLAEQAAELHAMRDQNQQLQQQLREAELQRLRLKDELAALARELHTAQEQLGAGGVDRREYKLPEGYRLVPI